MTSDMSVVGLLLDASMPVQIVMILLMLASLCRGVSFLPSDA